MRLGVPEALGVTTQEWKERLGGYIRMAIPDRREAVQELTAEGMSQREIAGILGVGQATVGRDLAVEPNGSTPSEEQTETAPDADPNGSSDEAEELELSAPPNELPVLADIPKPPNYVTLDQWKVLSQGEQADLLRLRASDKQFNSQSTASIEWAQWSWNPVTGCRHDCPYCYARDIAAQRYKQGFEPSILPERFAAPSNTKVPAKALEDVAFRNVFTCSMADLFGRWVPREWIEVVLGLVRDNPQWNFLFLTKFPKRYVEFEFPANAWLGTTVDCQARVKNAEDAFERVTGGTKWLSVEPLLEPLKFTRLPLFDWVVIGGASVSSQTPAWVPPIDWLMDLHGQARAAGCRIYYKDNCGLSRTYEDDQGKTHRWDSPLRIREFPWGGPPPARELPQAFHYLQGLGD